MLYKTCQSCHGPSALGAAERTRVCIKSSHPRMTGLGQTRKFGRATGKSALAPGTDSCTAANTTSSLFDHFVGASEQHGWEIETHGLRRLEIDHQPVHG